MRHEKKIKDEVKEDQQQFIMKVKEEQQDVDWGGDDNYEESGDPALDAALATLQEPAPQFQQSSWRPVKHLVASSSTDAQVAVSAVMAHAELVKFTQSEVEPVITKCIKWIDENMTKEGYTVLGCRMFGSHYYKLPLASSDADIAVMLGGGEKRKSFIPKIVRTIQSQPSVH